MSGDTGRAKIADVVNNRWGWSEIHWSTPDPLDFELDKYTCPIVDEYSIEGSVPDVVGLPAEYHEKTLKQMHDEFSAGAGDLHGELKRRAEQHLKSRTASNPAHTAQIGKKITQWIIVEIQPVIGVEYGILSSFPAVDLWAFLQPFQIGDKKRMKADRGWVSDDWPRAGWFRTSIRWFPKYDAKGNLLPHFTPMMAVYGRFGSAHKVMEWREIPCRLTREKTKSIDRHIVRPSYGAGSRFLFKLPVEVENMPTAEDQERKKQAAELLKSNSQLTDKQQDQLLRFEAGAYLKIWARNAFMDWGKDGTPRDDDSETCMKHMQELDNAELYARQKLNALFNSPLSGFSVPVDNTTGNPDDPNYYVKYYNDFSPQNILRQVHASGVFEPDRLAQDSLRQFMAGFRMAVAQKSDPLAGLASEERSDSSITEGAIKEQKDRFVPEIFQETPDKELRYLCGKDYFRPYSFRNHTWKRNKFSTDGTYHDDLWLHVMLWPAEILDDLRNLDGYFFKEPSKASLPLFFCVSLVYVAMLRILGGTVSKALADPKRKALAKKLKSLYEWEELPAIAAMIACYGLPNPAEVRWQGNKPKTVLNMLKYMKERLGSGEQSDVGAGRVTHEQIINQLYKFIQAAIGAAIYVPREAGASTQKMFLDAIAGVKYRSRDGFSDCEFFKPEPSVSALEQKIGLELTIASRTQKLAAWPVPAPLLQWLAFAITLKMALKGKGEVDFGGLFGPDAKERSVEFSLEPEGEAGVFFDLAAVWTLAAELDSAFTGAKLSSAKGEDLPDHPMTEALKKAFGFVNLQIGTAAKVVLSGEIGWEVGAASDGTGLSGTLSGSPCLKIELELPVYWKLPIASGVLAKLSCTLFTCTSSAAVLFPSGISVETVGGAGGTLAKFGPVKPYWWRFRDGDVRGYETIHTGVPIVAGKEFGFSFVTRLILPKQEWVAGKEVDHFEAFLVDTTPTKRKLARLSVVCKFSRLLEQDQIIDATAALDISHERLDYGDGDAESYPAFIAALLEKDQRVDLECVWNSDPNKFTRLPAGTTLLVKSPRITSLSWLDKNENPVSQSASLSFHDRLKLRIQVADFPENVPLYCHLFEIDENGKKDPAAIFRKDRRRGYFDLNPDGKGRYTATIPLWELGQIAQKPEDTDDFWELSCAASVDSNGKYPLRFASGMGTGKQGTVCRKYVRVKKSTQVKL